MDELINFLKSNKELDEAKLKEIKKILISRPMYEWYVETDGMKVLKIILRC